MPVTRLITTKKYGLGLGGDRLGGRVNIRELCELSHIMEIKSKGVASLELSAMICSQDLTPLPEVERKSLNP